MHASKHRLYHHLQLAAHRLRKVADRAVSDAVGLNTAQVAVLSVLVQEGSTTQRTIARTLGLNESAVTPMIGRLLTMGLVTRRENERDARGWILELSESGKDVIKQVKAPFSTVNKVLDREFEPEEIVKLCSQLKQIIDAFE